jgi:hypothetical protein
MSQEAEDRLKRTIETVLSPHFEMIPEVWGVHAASGRRFRIDYILIPGQQILEQGLEHRVIGLEVKAPLAEGHLSRAIEVANQAITYADCDFTGDDGTHYGRPSFVAIFPAIEDHVNGWKNEMRETDVARIRATGAVDALRRLLQKLGVAQLSGHRHNGQVTWSFDCSTDMNRIWHSAHGKGNLHDSMLHRDNWKGSAK